jgi:multimeric flavodoxin WrbA
MGYVIVMATPIYFYTMNAQMKILIDRTVPKYIGVSSKEFYFIVNAGNSRKSSMERMIEGDRGFTCCLSSVKEKGIIYGTGVHGVGEFKRYPTMQQAYEANKAV